MTFTKWISLLALMAGCAQMPDSVEFPVVFESWGSASASLSATEDNGVLHIDLKNDFKLIWISVSFYGGPEDVACIAKADMPEDMKAWMLANKTDSVPQDLLMLGNPLFDGEYAWRNYGGVSHLAISCPHDPDADRKWIERLRDVPLAELTLRFPNFDSSQGYKDIGYIIINLRCEDSGGNSREFYVLLNRLDLKRFKVGKPIFHSGL